MAPIARMNQLTPCLILLLNDSGLIPLTDRHRLFCRVFRRKIRRDKIHVVKTVLNMAQKRAAPTRSQARDGQSNLDLLDLFEEELEMGPLHYDLSDAEKLL